MIELNNLWACEEQFARTYFDCILNAGSDDIKAALDLQSSSESQILSINGDEATISIKGVLTSSEIPPIARFFGFNGTSYPEIKEALEIVSESEEIKKVKLAMDTPGGDAKGVDEVAQMVKALSKKKTVIAENQGMIASGGYWIASQANKIISTSPSNETGSIGVLIVGYDWSKAEENFGVKKVVIVSKNAPNKAADVESKKGISVLQKRVDALERVFISRIAEGRKVSNADITNNFGKGGLLIASDPGGEPDALTVGMIDKVVSKVSIKTEQNNMVVEANKGATEAHIDNIRSIETKENKEQETKGGESMPTLKEFLKENPDAVEEIKKLQSESFKNGITKAMENVAEVVPFINADYPDSIQAMVKGVLSGKASVDTLKGVVAYHDSTKEVVKAAAAIKETTVDGETPPVVVETVSEDGMINNEADFDAAVEEMKSNLL